MLYMLHVHENSYKIPQSGDINKLLVFALQATCISQPYLSACACWWREDSEHLKVFQRMSTIKKGHSLGFNTSDKDRVQNSWATSKKFFQRIQFWNYILDYFIHVADNSLTEVKVHIRCCIWLKIWIL